jgi:FkbM family methyltransferase
VGENFKFFVNRKERTNTMQSVNFISFKWINLRSSNVISPILFVLLALIQFLQPIHVEAQSMDAAARLQEIHAKLRLMHGSFSEEYPEQLMTTMYLSPDAKVLELGGNIGRNTCVIASILNDSRNLVSVESSTEIAKLLQENRDLNALQFHIEASALSKVPLVQSGWDTIPSEVDIPGFFRVNTIPFDQLQRKYGIEFDTFVVDCEGALYYILRDDPEILRNINLVIIENDFHELEKAQFVHSLFEKNGLKLVYNQAGGWGPCYPIFFQVWKK